MAMGLVRWRKRSRRGGDRGFAAPSLRPTRGDTSPEGDTERVLLAQGGYYVATGLFPFVSRRLFEAVTGPKKEWWLVQTVAGVVLVIGGTLLKAAVRGQPSDELLTVAGATAAVLAGIDVVYGTNGRIAPTYLIDAGAELGIVAALLESRRRARRA